MKNIIITSGGTSEKIDNVRKITNSSSGKLGATIANQFLSREKDIHIYYICSKNAITPELDKRLEIIKIESVNDLKETIEFLLKKQDIDYFIHSMAVSDYTTDYVTNLENIINSVKNKQKLETIGGNKISSDQDNLVIVLKKTPKIISMIKDISPHTFLVGFKLLDGVSKDELINVAKKLRDKNKCDLVVANDLENIRKGTHKAFIIDKLDKILEVSGKEEIASELSKIIFSGSFNKI